MVYDDASPPRQRGSTRDYAHLQLGDVILVTDPSVGLDRQIAFVEEVGYYDDSFRLRLGLVLWDDPFAQPPG